MDSRNLLLYINDHHSLLVLEEASERSALLHTKREAESRYDF